MHPKIAVTALALTAAMGFTITGVVGALPAAATPDPTVIGGCPGGYDRLPVDYLESIGPYVLPRLVDSMGNNDGYVCGQQLPVAAAEAHCKNGGVVACELVDLGLPYYRMRDNDVPGLATE